jgi:TusA-related sulfurtransferase
MSDEKILDLKGFFCPHTNILTISELEKIQAGSRLRVEVDNSDSLKGVIQTVKNKGHSIIGVKQKDEVFTILVEKK